MADLRDELATAFAWLTRLPVGRLMPASPPPLARAAWAFPVVGAVLALCAGGVLLGGLGLGLPPVVAALLATAALIVLTGGLHEDGLADYADGCGGRTREKRLEIMRDSRIGSYGVIALILTLSLRVSVLSELAAGSAALALAGLVAAGALSRAGMAAGLAWMPPARSDGLGRSAGQPGGREIAVAFLLAAASTVPLLMLLPAWSVFPIALFCAAAQFSLARHAMRRIGGQSGDVIGAIQQLGEISALLAILALA